MIIEHLHVPGTRDVAMNKTFTLIEQMETLSTEMS